MTPESRDYRLAIEVAEKLKANPGHVIQIKCFNLDEINMLKVLIPDNLKSRVYYTYMKFYSPSLVEVL